MADYAPHFTPRYRARYRAGGLEHYITLRFARGASPGTFTSTGQALVAALHNGFPAAQRFADAQGLTAEYAVEDSNEWVPSSQVPNLTAGTAVVSTTPVGQRIIQTSFPGKSPGSKARVVLFGILWVIEDDGGIAEDFKVTTTENTGVATAVTALNGSTTVAINSIGATWYNYVTVKQNDFLVRQVRRGLIS